MSLIAQVVDIEPSSSQSWNEQVALKAVLDYIPQGIRKVDV